MSHTLSRKKSGSKKRGECSTADAQVALFWARANRDVGAMFDTSFLLNMRHEKRINQDAMNRLIRSLESALAALSECPLAD